MAAPVPLTRYNFGGWSTGSDGSGTLYQPGDNVKNLTGASGGTVTLYAYWTVSSFELTLDANGGTPGAVGAYPYKGSNATSWSIFYGKFNETTDYSLLADATLHLPAVDAFVRTGYVFDGWSTAPEASSATYKPSATYTMPAGDTTLYAHWAPITYTISFVPNATDATGSTASKIMTYGVPSALPANGFTRYGYTFKGWTDGTNAFTYWDGESYTD